MSKKKQDTYSIQVRMTLDVYLDIGAENMEDALAAARELEVPDFVEFKGEWLDGQITDLISIFKKDIS